MNSSEERTMTPVQLRMARAAIGLSIDELASRVGLSHTDIADVESGATSGDDIAGRLVGLFEEAGVTLIGEDGVRYRGQPEEGTVALDDLNSANDD